jgi:serine/threonine protein kinase
MSDKPDEASPALLSQLGGYRILQKLGEGGMGVVYLAEDMTLKRHIALKVMHPRVAASSAARQRFLREARAAAALQHDCIVPIYHVDQDGDIPFLAMPFLKGEGLQVRLERTPRLPIPLVLKIGREVAEGLAAAHAVGLIHRDIKPANLWLEPLPGDPDNPGAVRVKILDFGLVRHAGEDEPAMTLGDRPERNVGEPGASEMSATVLTREGTVLGTPAYMAPEQARAEAVDPRSDLFSLGCVLYETCVGTRPFRGKGTQGVLRSVVEERPTAPMQLVAGMPPLLSGLVMRLLEKDPARRPASAREVVEALRAIEKQVQAAALPVAVPVTNLAPRSVEEASVWSVVREVEKQSSSTSVSPRRLHRRWLGAWVAGLVGGVLLLGLLLWLGLGSTGGDRAGKDAASAELDGGKGNSEVPKVPPSKEKLVPEAERAWRARADKGEADAQYLLGDAYLHGKGGVAQDDVVGAEWTRKAAENGHAEAQARLGALCYNQGRGVVRDPVEAVRWLQKSADQGYALGYLNLGHMYAMGYGVKQNYFEAARLFRLAGDSSCPDGYFRLGCLYRDGKGVTRNREEAIRWLNLAAGAGHENARQELEKLERMPEEDGKR